MTSSVENSRAYGEAIGLVETGFSGVYIHSHHVEINQIQNRIVGFQKLRSKIGFWDFRNLDPKSDFGISKTQLQNRILGL